MQPGLPTPMPSGATAPAPARANPNAAAASLPAAQPPTGTANNAPALNTPPPTQGVVQPGLPQAEKVAAALVRAEIYSMLYKYGMTLSKKQEVSPEFKKRTLGGAGIGAGVGALGGLAAGVEAASHIPYPPPKVKLPNSVVGAGGKVDLHAAANFAMKAEAVPKEMLPRLREVIKAHGIAPVLSFMVTPGALAGLAGAGVGAAAGLAYHGYKNRKKR